MLMISTLFKSKTQGSLSPNRTWKSLVFLSTHTRTLRRSSLHLTSKLFLSKITFSTTLLSHPNLELSRFRQNQTWPLFGSIYGTFKVVRMLNFSSTGALMQATISLRFEEQIWIPESPSAKIAGNGVTPLFRVESRELNASNAMGCTNLSITENLDGVVKLTPKLILLG